MAKPQLLVGVNVGIDRIHTIIVREEANGYLRLMGEHRRRSIIPQEDQALLIKYIQESILEAIRDAEVDQDKSLAIGIALPGLIDSTHEVLLFAPNLNITDVPLVAALKQQFHCHIALLNDVAAQGIAEQRIGAGKHAKNVVYLYVSYGIGSSIIIDGKLYTGADNLAGEIGHTAVCFEGPECSCKKIGCLEAFSSRRAITKTLQTLHKEEGHQTVLANELLKEPLDVPNALLVEAIDKEDDLTIQVVKKAAIIFGIGIATVINFLNPNLVILGGDVIDDIDLFFEGSVTSAKERSLPNSIKNVSIVRGVLGTTAGAYGAAVFTKQHLEQTERVSNN